MLGALLNHHEDREGAVRALVAEAVGELARPLGEETYRAWLAGERDLSPQTAYFFDPALTTAFPGEALRELVTNADVKVRREAILLFGLLGRDPAEAAWLDTIAREESDDVTRALAERSACLIETRAAGRP